MGLKSLRPIDDFFIEWVSLTQAGVMEIWKGSVWDGPSDTTIDTKNFMRGSLVDDALYQLIRMELLDPKYREPSDREFRLICREDGMSWIRAWWLFQGVHRFARFAASPENRREVKVAP